MRITALALSVAALVVALGVHGPRPEGDATVRADALQIASLYAYRNWGGSDVTPRVVKVSYGRDGLSAAVLVSFAGGGTMIVHLRRTVWVNMGVD